MLNEHCRIFQLSMVRLATLLLMLLFCGCATQPKGAEIEAEAQAFMDEYSALILHGKDRETLSMRSDQYHQIIHHDGKTTEWRVSKEEMLDAIEEVQKHWEPISYSIEVISASLNEEGDIVSISRDICVSTIDGKENVSDKKITRTLKREDGVLKLYAEEYSPPPASEPNE